MDQITISDIFIYPVKSTGGLSREEVSVYEEGLEYDRRWAIADARNNVLTAREYPLMFAIHAVMINYTLEITVPGYSPFTIPLQPDHKTLVPVMLFDTPVNGNHLSETADRILSDYLGVDCRLIFMDNGCERIMKPLYGGGAASKVSYADTAPILLVSAESLHELNSKLPEKIGMQHFRPNIVATGCEPNEEDGWKLIRIGDVLFDVNERCKRCVMTTIDPVTAARNKNQEPLRTLATYKRHARGGVSFGVTLIPRSPGAIRLGDQIDVVN